MSPKRLFAGRLTARRTSLHKVARASHRLLVTGGRGGAFVRPSPVARRSADRVTDVVADGLDRTIRSGAADEVPVDRGLLQLGLDGDGAAVNGRGGGGDEVRHRGRV